MIPEDGGVVMGVVLIGPTREEIEILDRFEEVPHEMVKERIEVCVGEFVREAHIYMKAHSRQITAQSPAEGVRE